MKILVVEDEPRAAEYLRQGLGESGYAVEVARNGTDGLHAAANGDHDANGSSPTGAVAGEIADTAEPGDEGKDDAGIQIVVETPVGTVSEVTAMAGAEIDRAKHQRNGRE